MQLRQEKGVKGYELVPTKNGKSRTIVPATAAFTLDVYGHVTPQMKRESADRMERFIKAVSSR